MLSCCALPRVPGTCLFPEFFPTMAEVTGPSNNALLLFELQESLSRMEGQLQAFSCLDRTALCPAGRADCQRREHTKSERRCCSQK